jgi:serine O-acetyltransferase
MESSPPTIYAPPAPPAAAAPAARSPSFDELVARLVESYHSDKRTQHLDSCFLPSRARTIEAIELLRQLAFPGFFDQQRLGSRNIHYHVGELLNRVRDALYEQVRQALRYEEIRTRGPAAAEGNDHLDQQADRLTMAFLDRLPHLRRLLALDVQAAFDGDPAAASTDETIFCYPGVDAIFIHRIAHELHNLHVPLLPRIMSEYAHTETGIDIHPGAVIGESFFIDHGTGVVIGETCVIGNRVKIYQGVTLGAKSTRGGQAYKGRKRHPTVEDDVTIYGGAIILGGDVVIGRGSTIGGSVFVTQSVPAYHIVKMKQPELQMDPDKQAERKGRKLDEELTAKWNNAGAGI